MKQVQFVIGEKGWIIEAIAKQWMERFKVVLGDANVECVYGSPVAGAKIYFHFIYLNALPVAGARNFVYVTHVDYFYKALILLKLAMHGVEFVSMSHQTKSLIERFVPGSVVHCISPMSIHFHQEKATVGAGLTLGLFFRLYPDKRKNDMLVASLIEKVQSAPLGVKLIIYGTGFEDYLRNIDPEKIVYDNSPFLPSQYRNYLELCDYVIYFGMDEGAISILDAAHLSVPVIATRQGYHIDIALPKHSMLFPSGKDVLNAAVNLIDSIDMSEAECDPVCLLNRVISTPERRWNWLFTPFVIPFKRNPFRAPDDWSRSLLLLTRSFVRRLVSFFARSPRNAN